MTISATDAEVQLPALLDRVQQGERITITKHGVAVAVLTPVEQSGQRDIRQTIAELKAFGVGRKLPADVTVRDLINEGRRF